MTIYFDLDGTIADLYNVPNWLEKIRSESESPYIEARPLCNLSQLARALNKLQQNGYKIGVITWLSKNATPDFAEKIRIAKRTWLRQHLPSVDWNEMHMIKYGTPKHSICKCPDGILFDDEEDIRKKWAKKGQAYSPMQIFEVINKFWE